jgi:hypothetical protein
MDFRRGSRAEIDGEEENTRLENRQEAEENRRSYAAESVQHRTLTRFPFLKILGPGVLARAPTDADEASVGAACIMPLLRAGPASAPAGLRFFASA